MLNDEGIVKDFVGKAKKIPLPIELVKPIADIYCEIADKEKPS